MERPNRFWAKYFPVSPRPFKIPLSVLERYRQGQIKESVLIKVPANSFLNKNSPRKSPEK